ncbi:WD domain G-beta repeat protein [Trichostrongylus colubriformis]|uniref:WD domain G-beta repeat protein n=1 Tax=Trichostrongylus colubriformis TaxID=6319 RepID=A0AAN8EZB7_TRICO
MMSASPDNRIVLCDNHSNVLKTSEPKMSSLFDVVVSRDGRFVAACGFTAEVFVYEVTFDRENVFQVSKRAFDLKGHDSGVFAVSFNASASRAVTVSRDGFWGVFDTDVRYAQGQDAGILNKGEWPQLKGASADRVRLAMSPSGESLEVSCGFTLKIFSSEDEHKDFPGLHDLHGDQRILVIKYSPCAQLEGSCGDHHVRVFRNIPEYHSQVVRLSKVR